MRAKYLLATISGLSIGVAGNISSVQADDVYVNLSVLENLEENASPIINQGPLFPVISSTDKVVSNTSSKAQVKKRKKIHQLKKEKLNIPKKEKVEIKQDIKPQTTEEPKVKEMPLPANSPFKMAEEQPVTDKVEAAPSKPVVSETLSAPENKTQIMEASPSPKKEEQQIAKQSIIENKQENSLQASEVPVGEKNVEVRVSSQENKQPTPIEGLQEEQKKTEPALLVPSAASVEQSKAEKNLADIYFAVDVDELTPENQTAIDTIIQGFENPQENKIAIFSYNLDDGNDSFRKKRVALNRAIAVRSYLLGKGYKNFSIKVVNLDEVNGKENSVHIEELK